ncbi:MAG: leucine-rich repeat domain-containing protein [Chlamydiales bacterium]|nr:leucine-rich repeat domain-containing protein [Chlamydiales bacterium]
MESISQVRVYPYTFDNHATVWFEETSWGGITPSPPQETAAIDIVPSSTFLKLLQIYQENVKKIRKKYGQPLANLTEVDFRGLGLTQLPPHILLECKKARLLDISGNDIHFLPVQLQALPLVSLNISGNTRLQPNIPEWLGGMPELVLTAHDIELTFIPEGFTQERVISNDLPKGISFGQTQQLM